MEQRKKDHIDLAFQSQTLIDNIDKRFYYEPLLSPHPSGFPTTYELNGKTMKVPVWVSSMTGGTELAEKINSNLAKACRKYGMGMGLGSCRIILDDETYFHQFDVRELIGDDLPLYANLGICQVEELVADKAINKIEKLVERLRADGLIIHVNPLQEWFQPEGDRIIRPPLETVKDVLEQTQLNIIVKEVGQGMGPESLRELLKLPVEAIEFAAFGGTNFAKVELSRSNEFRRQLYEPLSKIGNDAYSMMENINTIYEEGADIQCKNIIVSGGIKTFLDGYYFLKKSKIPAIYGQASTFLKYAKESYEALDEFLAYQIKGLELAYAYLTIKDNILLPGLE